MITPLRPASAPPLLRTRPRVEMLEDRLNPAPFLVTAFDTIDYLENLDLNLFTAVPSDPAGAVGPSHVVMAVNTSIGWYTKGGIAQAEMPMTSGNPTAEFWAPLSPSLVDVYDPKVVYDQFRNRFVVLALDSDTVNFSSIYVAVSKTSDPNDGWYYQKIDALNTSAIGGGSNWFDFPGLAVDENAVYITGNLFTTAADAFAGSRVVIMDKGLYSADGNSAVLALDPFAGTGLPAGTLQPAELLGTRPAGTTGTYLVSYRSNTAVDGVAGSDEVRVFRLNNPLSNPTVTVSRVSIGNVDQATLSTPDAPQPSALLVNTNDNDLLNAVWRDNVLTFAHHINPSSGSQAGQSTVNWVQVDTAPATPALLYQGFLDGENIGPGTHTYYPAVTVDGAGRIAVGYSASNSFLSPSSYVSFIDDPSTGNDSRPVRTARGVAPTTDARWGDYSAIGLDPTDQTVWQFNQYSGFSAAAGFDIWTGVAAQVDPGPLYQYATGAGVGGGPHVKVFRNRGRQVAEFFAYDQAFRGGVRVATGDVTGDQIDDVITVPGPGGGPHVKVFDGRTFAEVASFMAFEPFFLGGLNVAVGDVDGNGRGDVIIGADEGGGPRVSVFSQVVRGGSFDRVVDFFAYDNGFTGGVRVAAGKFSPGSSVADILVSPGIGGGPNVRVFRAADLMSGFVAPALETFVGDTTDRNGLFVAAGDFTGDGVADVVASSGGGTPVIRIIDGQTLAVVRSTSTIPVTGELPGLVNPVGVTSTTPATAADLTNGLTAPPTTQVGTTSPITPPLVNGLIPSGTTPTQLAYTNGDQKPLEANGYLYGLRVAVQDVNGDGVPDVIAGSGPNDRPTVLLLDGNSLNEIRRFFAYDQAFFGGVFVGGSGV